MNEILKIFIRLHHSSDNLVSLERLKKENKGKGEGEKYFFNTIKYC
jgi:hypothetical protein